MTAHLPSSGPQPILVGDRLERLRTRIHGELILPDDPQWDEARRAWQLLVDQRPAAVVVAADVQDVVAVVTTARELGLRVAPQSTGHGAGALGPLDDTILLRTSRLDTVEVHAETESVTVGAGARWGAVTAAAAAHGLAAVAGMASTVGVVGFALGGGLGWLARSHGLAANSVRSIEAVDARGRIIRIDDARNADLFWAARGGIAPVVVTSIELQLHPIERVQAGSLLWPIECATEVAHAWRAWAAEAPNAVTSLVRVLRYPPIPEIPEPLRGRAFVAIEAAIQGEDARTEQLLAPLRALDPELDTVRPMSPAELGSVHGDPPQPSPAHGASIAIARLSAGAVDAFLDAALAPSAGPLLSIELRHLGGEVSRPSTTGGAVAAIEAEGLVYAVGVVPVPPALEAVRSACGALIERLRPHAAGAIVKNFAETPTEAAALYGDTATRVRTTAWEWDPNGLIRTAHPLS